MGRRPNYRPAYVRGLIEGYLALLASADTTHVGLRYLVELADLDRALARLPQPSREVVFYHGLARLSEEDTADVLHKSRRWVSKLYRESLEDVVFWINGIPEEEL